MKIMVISDIHGSLENLEKALARYKEEKAEKLLILGDISNYGGSTYDYAIAENLNEFSDEIIAVIGNNDSFEFEELLDFKLEDVANIKLNNKKITMTHGHLFRKNRLPADCGEIFLQGHSHVAEILQIDDKIIANPGSIGRPRNGAQASYLIIDEEKIILKNLDGEILEEFSLN